MTRFDRYRLLFSLLMLSAVLVLTACPKEQTVRGAISGVSAGAAEARRQLALEFKAGGLAPEDADQLDAALGAVQEVAGEAEAVAAAWDSLPSDVRRTRLAAWLDRAEAVAASAEELTPRFVKNEGRRRQIAEQLARVRRGIGVLKVIQAALPPPAAPAPSSSPRS
ncbi:MAG TPA: hypothetical protein VF521_03585 [Pyrinomonadaceae bacterium]|jgi:hypothetical protein